MSYLVWYITADGKWEDCTEVFDCEEEEIEEMISENGIEFSEITSIIPRENDYLDYEDNIPDDGDYWYAYNGVSRKDFF